MLILLCLLIPLIAAAPAPPLEADAPLKEFIITQELPPRSPNDSSLIPRNPYNFYAFPVYFGTPSIGFTMAISTSSSKSFIQKFGFDKGEPHGRFYNPARSKTSKSLKEPFVYADGVIEASGQLYEDKMELSIAAVVPFGAITELKGLDKLYTDGQLGLGWTPYYEDDDTEPPVPIIHTLLKGRPKNLYQIYMTKTFRGISFGNNALPQCNKHETVWLPLLKKFRVPMLMASSFEIGKYQYLAEHRLNVDTSVSSIFMPKDPLQTILKTYNAKFDAQRGVYLTECSHIAQDWKIKIGGKEFQIKDDDVIMDIVLMDGRCALMVEESKYIGANRDQMYVLGLPFFLRHCVTFDVGGNQLGFSVSTDK